MKKRFFIATALLSCFIICLAAIVGDLNGTWKGNIRLPDGADYAVTYVFAIKGDSLTGSGQAEGDPKPISNGKLSGTAFTFDITNDDGSLLPHSGKYYSDGDSVSINVIFQGNTLHALLKRADKQ
jgi:hypothetical protein